MASVDSWVEKTDPKSGKVYYYNKTTKETSWTKPVAGTQVASGAGSPQPVDAAQPTASAPSAADGWVEKTDPKSGKVYYYNKTTKETSWTKPAGSAADATASAGSAVPQVQPAATPTATAAASAADGWIHKTDPKSGKVYYYNKDTKETSWTKPAAGATVKAEVEWVEKKDPKSGRTYFYNTTTKETAWQRPQGAAVPQDDSSLLAHTDSLPPNWVEKKDIVTGRTYYLHTLTKQPSWVRPSATSATSAYRQRNGLSSGTEGPTTQPADNDSREYVTTSVEGLWEKRFEPRTGTFYYFNTKTHETRWEAAGASATVAIDVTTSDTMYVMGGQPHTTSVVKWDGGIHGWVECPQQELPFAIDLPLVYRESERTMVVMGHRSALGSDVTVTVGLPTHGDAEKPPGSAVQSINARTPLPVLNGAAWAPVTGGAIVSGGYTDITARKTSPLCHVIDARNRRAVELPPLQVSRASHSIAVVDLSADKQLAWYAFATGGFDGSMKTNVVERYVLGQPYWEIIGPMRTPRAAHASIALDRTVYVFGGRSGYTVLNTGEYMHCQSTGWMDTAPMRLSRCNFSCATISAYVFCVGGWSGTEWLSSVEAYDTRLDTWRDVHNLPSPRAGFALLKAPLLQSKPEAVADHSRRRDGDKPRELSLAEQVAKNIYDKQQGMQQAQLQRANR